MTHPRRGLELACACLAPFFLASLAGLGSSWPLSYELLGVATIVAVGFVLRSSFRRAPPSARAVLLVLAGVQALALAALVGGRWSAHHEGLTPLGRPLALVAALAGCSAILWAVFPAPGPAPQGAVRGITVLSLATRLLAAEALALCALAALVAALRPGLAAFGRRMSLGAGLLGASSMVLWLALPRLRSWWGAGIQATDPAPPPPASRLARAFVVVAWLAPHLAVALALAPLVQIDSWINVLEPDLFVPVERSFHHPPLYCVLVKAGAQARALVDGLTAVVICQHLMVLGIALWVEDLVRRATGRAWVSAATGCALAVDGHLLMFAHSIMSEVLAGLALVLALGWLWRAEGEGRSPARSLLLAGAFAGLATLTREVAQAWFLVGALWLLGVARLTPRAHACLTFAAPALLLPVALVVHNYVFQGQARFTVASGRSMTSRLTVGMPSLTDPLAGPDDELERARAVIWRERDRPGGWVAVYEPLHRELGWDDERISSAVHRLYLEQARRHPLAFTRVTLQGFWGILRGSEPFSDLLSFHDRVLPGGLAGWDALPRVGPGPRWLSWLDALAVTHRWPVLLLALLAPVLCRGPARRLAVLALATAGYLIAIPALVEFPLPRYRVPAIPFLALAAGLGLVGCWERAPRGEGATGEPAGEPSP